jgi:hypothetical protein
MPKPAMPTSLDWCRKNPISASPVFLFVTGYAATASFFLRIVEQMLSIYQNVQVERYEQNRNQQTEEEIDR